MKTFLIIVLILFSSFSFSQTTNNLLSGKDLLAWKEARASGKNWCDGRNSPKIYHSADRFASSGRFIGAQMSRYDPYYIIEDKPYIKCMSKTLSGDWVFKLQATDKNSSEIPAKRGYSILSVIVVNKGNYLEAEEAKEENFVVPK